MTQPSFRNPYKYRSAETWDLIRSAYMRGESGPSLARRYDVTTWNIYKKAMEEGWSRRAMAAAPPPGGPPSSGETWTSWKDPPPESLRQGPRPLPGLPSTRRRWAPPPGQGPMPPQSRAAGGAAAARGRGRGGALARRGGRTGRRRRRPRHRRGPLRRGRAARQAGLRPCGGWRGADLGGRAPRRKGRAGTTPSPVRTRWRATFLRKTVP